MSLHESPIQTKLRVLWYALSRFLVITIIDGWTQRTITLAILLFAAIAISACTAIASYSIFDGHKVDLGLQGVLCNNRG